MIQATIPLQIGLAILARVKSQLRMTASKLQLELEIHDNGGILYRHLTLKVRGQRTKVEKFVTAIEKWVQANN